MRITSSSLLACGLLCLVTQVRAGEATDLARHLLSLSGRSANPKGVCVVPGRGELALEMARISAFDIVSQVTADARHRSTQPEITDEADEIPAMGPAPPTQCVDAAGPVLQQQLLPNLGSCRYDGSR